MIIRQVKIMNKSGLHARPATIFVNMASKFKSTIFVEKGDFNFNGKSLISILSAGIKKGDVITLIIEGEDEEMADRVMLSWINNNY